MKSISESNKKAVIDMDTNMMLIALKRFADRKNLKIVLKSIDGVQVSLPSESLMKFVACRDFRIVNNFLEVRTVMNFENFSYHFS